MGSYTFRWEHPAEEVFVTGTFDNWSKTIQLDKKDTVFEKTVTLQPTTEKILYKFVADGEWIHDHTGKVETDDKGNLNNVLYPEDIKPPLSMAQQTISSVAPGASTTEMAGEQPLQKENSPPGAFPETPAVESKDESQGGLVGAASGAATTVAAGASAVAASAAAALGLSKDKQDQAEQTFSVNPIPASEGAGNPISLQPGEKVPDPSTINANTVSSTVHDDPSLKSSDKEQTFGVAPLPATGGIGNPVHLAPGEKVPESSGVTANTIDSNVKLDQASYEKSDAGAPQLPPVASTAGTEAAGTSSIFGLGPQTTNMIPESGGMGMGKDAPPPIESQDTGPVISSVGATSTTNQLAGLQPKEPRGVPEVVSESQQEAHASPEAAANPEAVQEKKEMENELKAKVPEEGAASENTGGIAGAVAGGVAAAGAAVAGGVAVARSKAEESTGKDPVSVLPESVQNSINNMNNKSVPNGDAARETTASVPAEVTASQKDAQVAPEAAANPAAVIEKSQVEEELLKKVPESQDAGAPAPTEAAATSATAPTTASGAPQLADPVGGGLAPISMDDKALNASADTPATVPAAAGKVDDLKTQAPDSRDVSPMSKPTTQTQPVVTTGAAESSAPTTSKPIGTPRDKNASSGTPQKRNSLLNPFKNTPDSSKSTGTEGKKKGFFSKLKEKLKN